MPFSEDICVCGHPFEDHVEELDSCYCVGCTIAGKPFYTSGHRFEPAVTLAEVEKD